MDKGYHDNGLLADCAQRGVRTYIPEREHKTRRWTDKPQEQEAAFRANRRRVRGERGRRLSRRRSERCERTFAHVCETGGGRRVWVRGQENARKLYVLKCAAYNLGLLLWNVWGLIKPQGLAGLGAAAWGLLFARWAAWGAPFSGATAITLVVAVLVHWFSRGGVASHRRPEKVNSLAGC